MATQFGSSSRKNPQALATVAVVRLLVHLGDLESEIGEGARDRGREVVAVLGERSALVCRRGRRGGVEGKSVVISGPRVDLCADLGLDAAAAIDDL